jgi:acetyl-CoA C-acetyltransferase
MRGLDSSTGTRFRCSFIHLKGYDDAFQGRKEEGTVADAVIVAAARTPIGRAYKGSMVGLRADDLAATIVRAALDLVPELDPHTLDDLILGCAAPGGEQGFNMARVVSVLLGLDEVPGTTVARYCSSSLQATRMAFHAIRAGEGDAFVCGGVEVVSGYVKGNSDRWPDTKNPVFNGRTGSANGTWHSARELDQLPDVYVAMGETAENVARLERVTREEQDAFALLSQTRYAAAVARGRWEREITPVTLADGSTMTTDDSPRPGTTAEGLAQLKPAFREDGTVTAGNACPLNDGAAALVIMSETRAAELGCTPLARIRSTGVSALDPEIMGLGPVEATRRALKHAGMSAGDLDLVEINEAFAAQVVPSVRKLGLDLDRVNVDGGAIALGHPFGMTGARMTTTLLNNLREHDGSVGLVTMCVAGGQGMAMVIERLS